MELLVGEDLARLLAREGALDPNAAARVVGEAARGLAALHAHGLIHRDVKPSNLFLHREGAEVVVKVCDLGIAKPTGSTAHDTSSLTGAGAVVGSSRYMSPEQAAGSRELDARSDVYAACVTLYEALSGENPWQSLCSYNEIVVAIATRDAPPLRAVAPWVPRALLDIVEAGLTRDRERRLASADELADRLLTFAGDARLTATDLGGVPASVRALAPPDASETKHHRAAVPASTRRNALRAGALLIAAAITGGAVWLVARRPPESALVVPAGEVAPSVASSMPSASAPATALSAPSASAHASAQATVVERPGPRGALPAVTPRTSQAPAPIAPPPPVPVAAPAPPTRPNAMDDWK